MRADPSQDPRVKGVMRVVLADGLLHRGRVHQNNDDLKMCPICRMVKDSHHIYWRCPKWQHLRHLSYRQCEHLPSATRMCGIICPNQGPLARQLLIPPVPHLPDRAGEDNPGVAPPPVIAQTRVPLFRIKIKTKADLVPTIPPRPSSARWTELRHEMTRCPGGKKGARVMAPEGYEKFYEQDVVRIRCLECLSTSLWCSKNRFVRRHECPKDENGATTLVLPPQKMMRRG